MKKSELNRLARKWLPVVLLALKVANQFAELVSKFVNYICSISKLRSFVQDQRQTSFCTI